MLPEVGGGATGNSVQWAGTVLFTFGNTFLLVHPSLPTLIDDLQGSFLSCVVVHRRFMLFEKVG